MSLYPELDDLSLDELIQRFHGHPLDGKKYVTVYYEEVAAVDTLDAIRPMRNDPHPHVRAAVKGAVHHLSTGVAE
jgi:hypothetical protein